MSVIDDYLSSVSGRHRELLDQLRAIIVGSYNEALIPIFLALVPLTIISIIALSFLREKPLATGSEPATTTSATHIG